MNLIPNLRTEEEKKNFQAPAKPFWQEIEEAKELVKGMSDKELNEIIDGYMVSHNDYAKQQAASRTLRSRENAADTRTVEQQYCDAVAKSESILH